MAVDVAIDLPAAVVADRVRAGTLRAADVVEADLAPGLHVVEVGTLQLLVIAENDDFL